MMPIRSFCFSLVMLAVFGCASAATHEAVRFESTDASSRPFRGVLTLPEGRNGPVPVVMLIHGSAGVDSRYAFHKPALLGAGMGTFEVDFKTGVFTSLTDRPPIAVFQPWVFGALETLRTDPRVDPDRIAVMGFSLGGHLSISAASKQVVRRWLPPGQTGFVAHVGFYPVCRLLNRHFGESGPTGAPMLIFCGEKDSWGDGRTCGGFVAWLNAQRPGVASLTVYPGAHHAFDRNQASWTGYAPYAENRTATLKWNKEAAEDSRRRAVAFLRNAFGLPEKNR